MMKIKLINSITLLVAVFILSCNNKSGIEIKQDLIPNIIKPEIIVIGENSLSMSDYFLDVNVIDSVESSSNFSTSISNNQNTIDIITKEQLPWISELRVFAKGEPYSILLQKSRKIIHKLEFDPIGIEYNTVQIKGSLNDWNPQNSNFTYINNKWIYKKELNPGKYHYQLVLDGESVLDPGNEMFEDNNLGGFNSVMYVGNSDIHKLPKLSFEVISNEEFSIESTNDTSEIFVLWQNFRLKPNNNSYSIPEEAINQKRSWITVRSYNDYGIGNDLLVPLEYGKVVESMDKIDRYDKEASILYFLMLDRFSNGNPENDKKVDDPEVDKKANYYGGDIAGVHEKLKSGYFENLGINTIWLSPITQNTWGAFKEYPEPHRKFTGYHGYWPKSLTSVDKRFGTEEELQALINDAHDRDINIILDFVSNHVHQESEMYKNHPDWATNVDLPDGSKNIRLWDSQRLTTWFDTFLPSWDFDNPEVINHISDSALYWVQNFNIDGFRHDATKHIPNKFWKTLTHKLKNEGAHNNKNRLLQIGETFGGRELIGNYVSSGMLDGQFDFNLYFDARSVLVNDQESFQKLSNSLHESFSYYGYNHMMGNITGNHDMARFISYAGEGLRFDEESQSAGWERDIKVENPIGYKKLSMLIAFNMTIPGIPVIYYGDEYGMPGAGDPDNRRPMQFKNLSEDEIQTKILTEKLVKLRKNNIALTFGSFNEVLVEDKVYVYYREYLDQIVLVVMNKSSEEKEIEVNEIFTSNSKLKSINGSSINNFDDSEISFKIPAYSFEIIYQVN